GTDLEARALDQLAQRHVGLHRIEGHREIGILGLRLKHRAQMRIIALPRIHEHAIALVIERREKWQALNVVPMRVADEQVNRSLALAEIAGDEILAQPADAGAGVDDDARAAVGNTHLDAGGVPSVAVGVDAGRWKRPAYPPEPDLHRDSPLGRAHGSRRWPCIESTVTRPNEKIHQIVSERLGKGGRRPTETTPTYGKGGRRPTET